MAAKITGVCWEEDCWEEPVIALKVHRRDDSLLAPPDFATCASHLSDTCAKVTELMLVDVQVNGVSIMRT